MSTDRILPDPAAEPAPWVAGFADAIMALGSPRFWDALVIGIGALVENQGVVVFRYTQRREPSFVFGDLRNQVSRGEFRQYRKRAYLIDPFYLAYLERQPGGVHTLKDLAADRFFFTEYYRTYYIQTGLSDEVGIFCWIKPDDLLIVSLVRRKGASGLAAAGIRALRQVAPLVTSLVRRHVAAHLSNAPTSSPPEPEPVPAQPHFGEDGVLTQREAAVANLILRGHSSPSMALLLGISVETVKVHRRHIYKKLLISSQAELFSLAITRSAVSEPK